MRFNERSSGLIDDFSGKIFHILGCGAIGSAAATQLARMGADQFALYDMDKVGVENIGVSQYSYQDIGRKKVVALEKHIDAINDEARVVTSHGSFDKYIKQLDNDDIIILGFDSMEIRKEAIEIAFKDRQKPFLIIDGRMGAEEYQQYVILNPTLKKYLKYWYSDENASDEPCNAKATAYCSNMSGSFIANSVKKIMTGERYNEEFFFNFPNLVFGKSPFIG
jgi:molybdopterin/thiamine biosynthesis adenylyltransferase